MDLVVIAGTHWSGCSGLREQIDSVRPDLAATGIHVPIATVDDAASWHRIPKSVGRRGLFRRRDLLDQEVRRARVAGAATLLLMSEEFETAAMDRRVPEALARHAAQGGGRAIVLLLFRHQVDYLNLVFAGRAVAGVHGRGFADFVESPNPSRQFDYLDVVGRFEISGVEVRPIALADAVSGTGLSTLLATAGVSTAIETGPIEVEQTPDAARVGLALLSRRAVDASERSRKKADAAMEARQIADQLSSITAPIGPFWGWTDSLLAQHLPDFDAVNQALQERYGLKELTWKRPEGCRTFAVSDLEPAAIKRLVDRLAGV